MHVLLDSNYCFSSLTSRQKNSVAYYVAILPPSTSITSAEEEKNSCTSRTFFLSFFRFFFSSFAVKTSAYIFVFPFFLFAWLFFHCGYLNHRIGNSVTSDDMKHLNKSQNTSQTKFE